MHIDVLVNNSRENRDWAWFVIRSTGGVNITCVRVVTLQRSCGVLWETHVLIHARVFPRNSVQLFCKSHFSNNEDDCLHTDASWEGLQHTRIYRRLYSLDNGSPQELSTAPPTERLVTYFQRGSLRNHSLGWCTLSSPPRLGQCPHLSWALVRSK